MKLEYKPIKLELTHPFGISREVKESVTNVLVKITWKENGKTYAGYGEAHPSKFYGETADTVMAFYKWVEEVGILKCTPYEISEINTKLDKMGRNFAAKAGIDTALYDLLGKIHNIPTYKYLGFSNKIPRSSFTIDISNIEVTLKKTGEALMQGYDIFKVKLGTNFDEETMFSVRQAAPDVKIRVDANAAWDLKTALRMVKVLEEYKVEFIEQPLAQINFRDLKILRTATTIPIIVDESCVTLDDVPRLAGLADGINIKISKNGGITRALKIMHAAQACNLKIMLGCFIETSLGIAAASAIGANADYIDLDGCLLLKKDPFEILKYKQNELFIQEIPGITPENFAMP